MHDLLDALAAAWQLILSGDSTLVAVVSLSLSISLTAVVLASVLGLPLAAVLAVMRFPGQNALVVVVNALMGLPPVVVGLFVYMLLSRSAPLGSLGLLFTPTAMVIAQVLKPLRSRANLRPPSRFASVIDRLLRNQNPLENRNNLRSSSPYLILGRRPGNRAAILPSETHRDGSHSCSDHRCSVRAFDDSTARRLAAAASRGPRPGASRAGWRLRQSHHRLQQAIAVLSSAGDDSRPHHVF